MTFDFGETVICSITVKNSAGNLQDPVTSMKIVIDRLRPNFANVVASVGMTLDSTGTYHYDYNTASDKVGEYEIAYTAIDGIRTTIQKDTFLLN